MHPNVKWQRNSADFVFRLIGILIPLGIAEIFIDLNWKIVGIGLITYYVFFCIFHTPNYNPDFDR